MATTTDKPGPGRPTPKAPGRHIDPRVVVGLLGVLIAITVVLTDERDPIVFAIPVLVLTSVLVLVLTLAGTGDREFRVIAKDTGLRNDGLRPLPPVTPLLADVTKPVHVLSGELDPGGPGVRLAKTPSHLVTLTDAPVEHVDSATREWLDEHPLRPEAAIEDGLLVVAVDRDAPPRALLELTRELELRL